MRTTPFALQLLALGVVLALNLGAASTGEPDENPQMARLLQEARELIDTKKPAAAIERCDKVIAKFKASYGNDKQKFHCARTSAESLGYIFVELDQLDEAEKKYQQCLADDPNDTKAKRELDYVRSRRAKRKAQ